MKTLQALAVAACLTIPSVMAVNVVPQAASGATTITLNPSTPALNEPLVISIHGSWTDGCVPRFQSVTPVGMTVMVDALANADCSQACLTVVTPYAFDTTRGTITTPGIYTVEYYVTECNKPRTLIASQTFPISGTCQFDRSLSASATAVRVGTTVVLRWCDPSVIPGADFGYSVSFYRVLVSHSANGPFVSIGDVPKPNAAVTINFDPADIGAVFFFIEAHGCNVTIAGCSGDTVLRSNVVRVDVVSDVGCLPDASTLCLNNNRFEVTARWQTADGNSGRGQAVRLAADSGYFWFFGPDNVELVVKALNACTQPAPRYWFFASGLTNVEVDITVTDTKIGTTRTYHNPLGTAFQPVQDTGAFATCP